MTAIVFRTPGTLDVRAFTTMGVNAKPNTTSPIGYFGTGLKYAVAVLARLGAQLTVHTGGHRYWFEAQPMTFRGTDFQQLTMRRDAWVGGSGWRLGRRQKLPFTTLYGRNWEAWMAFRELYSNTLDEGGTTEEYPEWADPGSVAPPAPWQEQGKETLIIVSGCDEFVQAYRDRAAIFIDLAGHEVKAALPGVEVREGSTQRLYYQGMRAKDVGKPTLNTYNFTTAQNLTEDRQLAHEWQVRTTLANIIAGHCEDEKLIEAVITAKDELWEHGLEPSPWVTPSRAFHNVMMRRPRGVGGGWGGYYGTHDTRPEATKKDLWRDALRPWKVDGGDVLAADGTALFSKPFNMNEQVWKGLADKLCSVANRADADHLWAGVTVPDQTPRAMVAEDIMHELDVDHPFEEGDEPDELPLYVPMEAFDAMCECPAWTDTHEVIEGGFRVVKCAECGRVAPRDRDQVDF